MAYKRDTDSTVTDTVDPLADALATMQDEERERTSDGLAYHVAPQHRYHWREYLTDADQHDTVLRWAEKEAGWPTYAREVFARLYSGDEVEELDEQVEWATKAHDLASELPEWEAITQAVQGYRFEAGLSAMAVAKSVLRTWLAQPEQEPPPPQGGGDQGDQGGDQGDGQGGGGAGEPGDDNGQQGEGQAQGGGDGQGEGQGQPEQTPGNRQEPGDGALRGALRNALSGAMQDVQEVQDAMAAAGWGRGGTADNRVDGKDREKLASMLHGNRALRKIIMEAGRLLRAAASKRRSEVKQVQSEIADVTVGDDLAKLLPCEAALLAHDLLKYELARKLVERSALQYELKGREQATRGPVVMCLDTSGSMGQGGRNRWANALAIAIAQQAVRDGRQAMVVPFDYAAGDPIEFTRESVLQSTITVASLGCGGGTDWERPLSVARSYIDGTSGWSTADVVLLSDDDCRVSETWRRAWEAWRDERGVTCYGIAVGGASGTRMKEICDRTDTVADLVKDDGRADLINDIHGR